MEKTPITLDNLNASNLPELQGWKDKQIQTVNENPYIEIEDNKTYEIAKQRRTALLKARTSLEGQDKTIASKIANFRKEVKAVSDELILITLPHEEKQQSEVKRWEQIKENERIEKERIENERIQKIKDKVSEMESECYSIINSWDISFLKNAETTAFVGMNTDFDFEEFDILYQQAKLRVQEHCENKIKSLQEKENQRLENERLAREKAESDAKLKAMEDEREKERKEREEKEREQKEQMFEVRKNRLAEIGFKYLESQQRFLYSDENIDISKLTTTIFNSDIIDFENIITDAKKAIQEAKDLAEKQFKEKADKETADLAEKKKIEKENKERVKRLSKDKSRVSEYLEVCFPWLDFESKNQEIQDFEVNSNIKIQNLKNELLTELENL